MNVGEIDLSLVLTSKDFENQLNNTVSKSVGKIQKSINKGVDNTVKDATGRVQNAFNPIQNELSYTIQSATNEINSEVSSTFDVMADGLSNSIGTAINDLEQDINDLDIHFNGINYDSLTEGLGTATTSVLNSFEEMENGADRLGDSIDDISTQFSQSFNNIPEFLGRTDNAFDDAINGADRLGYALHDLDSSLTTGGRNLERSVDNVGSDLRGAIHDVDNAVDGVRNSVQQLDNAVDGIGNSVDGAVDDIADSLNDIEDSVDNVTHSLSNAVDGINNSTEGLADNFAGVGETIGEGMNAGGDAVEGLIGKVGKLGSAIATAFAVGQLSEFVMECTEIGSDLAEVSNVVDTVFTSLNDKVVQFSRNATAQYGMSETMAMEYVGTLGSMARAFDFTEQEAYDMATTLTGLTADVSSFYNLDHEEAYTKLKSVFTGETESLKDLGVVMTQTALDQYALAHGFGKTTSQMTEQEKTALRYQFVLDKLKFAQGDFAKTSGEWANQMRIFSLQWETLKGTLGRGFIAILSPVLLMLNKIIARIIDMANIFVEAISKMGSVFRGFSFGGSAKVNTSNVPKLAKGGYVKKNNPQLVMIGDNTQEGEIVAPESKLIDAVKKGVGSTQNNKETKITINAPKTTTANGSSKSGSNKALMGIDEINKLGDNTKEVTNNTNKLSKAIKKVGTTAKKVINESKKALMGFDELNILNIDEETNGLDNLDNALDKIKDPLGGLDKIKDPTSKLDKIKDPIKGLDNALSKIKDPTSGLKGITDSIPKASSSIGDLSKGVSGLGDSLKGLDSDALKGLGTDSLAGLDAGLETATQDTGALNGELDQTGGRLDTLNTKAGQLQQMFKQGFELGLGEVNFDDIINHAKGIMASLQIILTDPKLTKAVDNFWNSLVFNVGQILGSLASVGLTAVELLLGGIDLYLAKNKGFIVDFFTSEFNALSDIMDIIGDTFRDVADIFTVFRSDEAKSILAGFIEIFANSFMGILELATKLGRDLLENITKPIRENKDKIKDTLQGLLGVIEPIVTGIADFVTNSMIKINEMYDEHIKPLIDTIGDTLSYLFGLILDNINTYVMPILQDVGAEIKRVFEEYISPVMEQVIDIIGQVADILGILIEYGFKPMGEFIINTLVPVLGVALAGAFIIVVEALKIVFEVLKNLLKILQGVLDFIIGAFTNDWDRAWKGLGTVVEGVFGTIDALTGGMLTKIKNFALQIGDWFGKAYEFMKNAFKGAGDWATKTGKDIENGFKSCMKGVGEWFGKQWEGIKGVFKGAGEWFGKQFGNARETIINQFKGLPEWLNNMWRNTTNSLVKIGGKFGNMISGAIKSAVNYVLALCENKINGFISLFNGILKYVNKLPGVNIGSMQKVSIPRFANGGYVKANTPQLAIVGDNKREGEIIAPESKIAEAVNTGVSLALEKVVNMLQQTQGAQQTGDIVIPVSIGQEHIDTIIVNSQRRQNLRSGGRV